MLADLGATDPEGSARHGVLFTGVTRGEERVGATLRAVVGPVLAAQPGLS